MDEAAHERAWGTEFSSEVEEACEQAAGKIYEALRSFVFIVVATTL